MTMSLRLTDEQDQVLTALAKAEGVSKREAVVRAILDRSSALNRDTEVRRLTRKAEAKYGPLLDRLGQ